MKKFTLAKIVLIFLISCQEPTDETVDTSWEIIHKKILKPNCSNCHMDGSAIEKQSGLKLYQRKYQIPCTMHCWQHDGNHLNI